MTLFDIVGEFKQLYEIMTDSDADEQVIADTLEGLKGELEVKGAGYVAVINQLDMEAKKAKELSEAFKAKAEVRSNNIKRLKNALKDAMTELNMDAIEAGDYTIKVQKNGGKQPLKIDGDVPDDYLQVIYQPDIDRIRYDLEEGKDLPFAHLEPRGKHIVIK